MGRGRTVLESRFDKPPDTVAAWSEDAVTNLLGLVWRACDLYCAEALAGKDLSRADEELERDITQDIELRLSDFLTRLEPFRVQHERSEILSSKRQPPPARSPQCDIAFVWRTDDRIMWPVEAKVLPTDGSVADYISEITDNYLTCRKAVLSKGAVMLGYLLSGDADKLFTNIARKLPCVLSDHPDFPTRRHKTSDHKRTARLCQKSPRDFRCHHLVLEVSKFTHKPPRKIRRKS